MPQLEQVSSWLATLPRGHLSAPPLARVDAIHPVPDPEEPCLR